MNIKGSTVALLTEGVDRNHKYLSPFNPAEESPSSRRAWIEISATSTARETGRRVALLTEGVDRNIMTGDFTKFFDQSPSSRRAWIEIMLPKRKPRSLAGRPPHGGRG